MAARIPAVMCITDGVEMTCEEKGKIVEVVASWGSYYKISADIYMCPICSTNVALPATEPIIFQYEGLYNMRQADYEVNIN